VPPPLTWGKAPPKTVAFDLFIYNFLPVHGKLVPVWAVAGLKPTSRGLSGGRIPPGAVVGRNRLGQVRYSLCPPKGKNVQYEVLLYALQHKASVMPGFDAEALTNSDERAAEAEGSLLFSYKRL
jgi:phosphatidylethanolamine-binding protein (PEBP) family uncharacterized protein